MRIAFLMGQILKSIWLWYHIARMTGWLRSFGLFVGGGQNVFIGEGFPDALCLSLPYTHVWLS